MRWGLMGLLLVGAAATADDAAPRSYALPGHGSFQMNVPASWKDSEHRPVPDQPPTLMFDPPSGAPFKVLVTPIWKFRADIELPTVSQVKDKVRHAAELAAPQAIEKEFPLKELKGEAAKGYYFSATDKAPNPGEFKYMSQGMIRVGELVVTFTVLTNDGQEAVVRDALAMVAGARQRK